MTDDTAFDARAETTGCPWPVEEFDNFSHGRLENLAHLRNMTAVTEMGGIVFPPLPAFYHRPTSIDELIDDTVERVLALIGVEQARPKAWTGL